MSHKSGLAFGVAEYPGAGSVLLGRQLHTSGRLQRGYRRPGGQRPSGKVHVTWQCCASGRVWRDGRTTTQEDLIPLRRAEKKYPLLAREVAAKRYDKEALLDEGRALRLERRLEMEESAERRAGRDYEQSFSTRQAASTGEAAIIAAHTTPGPIAGLRIWQRPRFADVKFVDTSVDADVVSGNGLRDLFTKKPSDSDRNTATRDALRAAVAQTELGQPLRGTPVASGAIQLTKQLLAK